MTDRLTFTDLDGQERVVEGDIFLAELDRGGADGRGPPTLGDPVATAVLRGIVSPWRAPSSARWEGPAPRRRR